MSATETATESASGAAGGIDAAMHTPEFMEDPYPVYAQLRALAPVHHLPAFHAYIATSFEHVRAALLDERYQMAFGTYQVNRMGPTVVDEPYFQVIQNTVVVSDGAIHSQMRQVFRQAFTPKRVRGLVDTIGEQARRAIDEFAADGRTELVATYSNLVPLAVISSLLGVPERDRAQIFDWVRGFTPVLEVTPMSQAELRAANAGAVGLSEYFRDMMTVRRAAPGDDFVSEVLAANAAHDRPLSDDVLAANFGLLYFAGQDTQSKMLTNILAALQKHPDEMTRLVDGTVAVADAMQELYRYDTVGQFVGRITTAPVQLGGCDIDAGSTVMVCIGAANRDPAVFDDPERLDLTRGFDGGARLVPNMSFIVGEHHCMGKHLASTALPIMLEALLSRLGRIESDLGAATRHPSLATRGYDAFPVHW